MNAHAWRMLMVGRTVDSDSDAQCTCGHGPGDHAAAGGGGRFCLRCTCGEYVKCE